MERDENKQKRGYRKKTHSTDQMFIRKANKR